MNRYAVKFTNGYWRVFDRERFEDVNLFFSQDEAEKVAERMNARKGGR